MVIDKCGTKPKAILLARKLNDKPPVILWGNSLAPGIFYEKKPLHPAGENAWWHSWSQKAEAKVLFYDGTYWVEYHEAFK